LKESLLISDVITQDVIDRYCELMQDHNPIHKAEIGVVPGLLLTTYLSRGNQAKLKIINLSIDFMKPIFVNEKFDVTIRQVKSKMNLHCVKYSFSVEGDVRQEATAKLLGEMDW